MLYSLQAHRYGGLKGWKRAVKEARFDAGAFLRERPVGAPLPWGVLDTGVDEGYFVRELEQARKGAYTIPCFDGCRRCHVCGGDHDDVD